MEIYYSNDYAGVKINKNLEVYYGYEAQYCKKHKRYDCHSDECDSFMEWCLKVEREGETSYYTTSELKKNVKEQLETPKDFLIAGLSLLLSEN